MIRAKKLAVSRVDSFHLNAYDSPLVDAVWFRRKKRRAATTPAPLEVSLRVKFLSAMLAGYPDPPEGYDGWWLAGVRG